MAVSEINIPNLFLNHMMDVVVMAHQQRIDVDDPSLMAETFLLACVADARYSGKPHVANHRFVQKIENTLSENARGNTYPMAKRLRTLAAVIRKVPGSNRDLQSQALRTLATSVTELPND